MATNLDYTPGLFDEAAAPTTDDGVIPNLFDDTPAGATGEIRNPVGRQFNLFPTTTSMFKGANSNTNPIAKFAALAGSTVASPFTGIADLFRDAGVAGKTYMEQNLGPQDMSFQGRLEKNLMSDRSLGSEVADNYLPAIAERALANGENPEDVAKRLALIHGGMSNLFDIGGFVGTGGPEGVSQIVKGGANIVKKLRAPKEDSLAKLFGGVPDEAAYQDWLKKNAQHPEGPNPLFDIPLHPSEQAKVEIAQTPVEVPGQNGQLGFRDFIPQGEAVKEPVLMGPEDSPDLLKAIREQGQQELDFSKPKVPLATIKPQFENPNDPKMLDFLAQYIEPKDLARLSPEKRLALANLPANELRDVVGKVSKSPSAFEDLKTILTSIEPAPGLNSGVPRARLTPEGKAALDRWRIKHGPEIAEHLKVAGNDVAGYIKSKLPTISDAELATAVHYLSKDRVANFNTGNLSPEHAQVANEVADRNVDLNIPASDNPLSYQERVGRAGTPEAREAAEALSAPSDRNTAAGMDTLSIHMNEAFKKVLESTSPQERTVALDAARDAMDSFKKAGTAVARMLESRKHIFADLQSFKAEAQILYENGEITADDIKSIEEGISSLKRIPKPVAEKFWGMLHEFGINNMLSVMSNMRNIAGNTMMAPLAPITRGVQGAFNAAIARPVNKLVAKTGSSFKPFKGDEVLMREAPAMVDAYIKNFGRGLRLGGKYFSEETDAAVYKKIQKEIDGVNKNTKLTPRDRSIKLIDLEKQKKHVLKILRGSDEGGIRESAGLQHKRQIPGKAGKVINTMTRGLSAMDMAFRYPMGQAAENAIRTRVGIKEKIPLDKVKWTSDMAGEAAEEAAYYTFNEALGGVAKGIQHMAQPKSAGGYAAANVLVFMKNALNVGKIALDHGALETGFKLLDPMVGPLLNRWKKPGNYGLDSKAIAKSLAGLGITYTSYAMFKKAGWEFFPASDIADTAGSEQRRASGVTPGVFAIDASGKKHDLSQAQPATMFFNKMAMWDEAQRLAAKDIPQDNIAWKSVKSQMAAWLDSSMLTGPRDVYSAWDKAMKLADPEERAADEMNPLARYGSKQAAARLVPAFLDEINRTWLDKTARDPNTAPEYFAQRLPVASKSVAPKVSWAGEDVKRLPSSNPFKEMSVGNGNISDTSRVNKELLRLGIKPEPVSKRVRGVPLTNEERRGVRRDFGPEAERRILKIMDSPAYERMSEFKKASQIEGALKQQSVGEQRLLRNKINEDPAKFRQKQKERVTKGRSLTSDDNFPFLK